MSTSDLYHYCLIRTRPVLVAVFAALIIHILTGSAAAFHSGGVAECVGCHNLHDARSDSGLLHGTDASSTCLICHGQSGAGSYLIATPDADMPAGIPPGNMTPAGDFGWLKKTYFYTSESGANAVDHGDHHGHNIVAQDFGYTADSDLTTAPGGDMDAKLLACTSCHDQHGKLRRLSADGTFATTGAPIVGSGSYNNSPDPSAGHAVGIYRLLRGTGSGAGSGGKTFIQIFHAVVPSDYNRSEFTTPTRVSYGVGISLWCLTCHPDQQWISGPNAPKHNHIVDSRLDNTAISTYAHYMGSGNLKGTKSQSFDSLVPFALANGQAVDYTRLKTLAVSDGSQMGGPDANDRIMCISCHRAHATGWNHMMRWNYDAQLIAVDGVWPGTDSPSGIASQERYTQGRTVAETARSYNDTRMHYASYQKALCNKCHATD
jgi:hypothetical protein